MVFAQNKPALVLEVKARIAKHATNGDQLFIVDFQYVASAQRLAYHLLAVEVLAQVDVANAQTVAWGGIKKLVDGGSRHLTALCQRTETHGPATSGQ